MKKKFILLIAMVTAFMIVSSFAFAAPATIEDIGQPAALHDQSAGPLTYMGKTIDKTMLLGTLAPAISGGQAAAIGTTDMGSVLATKTNYTTIDLGSDAYAEPRGHYFIAHRSATSGASYTS